MMDAENHEHCMGCFRLDCASDHQCPLVACTNCAIRLHACKQEDHLEICAKTTIACPLGCGRQFVRRHLSAHFQTCNAYTLHCKFCWNRSFVSMISKRVFKRIAKELEEMPKSGANPLSEADVEVRMALRDQEQIFESMRCSRLCRVKQRDYLNRTHPLLPLRYKQLPGAYRAVDSSDEEANDEQIIMRSTPQAFAGCPICRTDPGEQHLHVLGSANAAGEAYSPELKLDENAPSIPLDALLPPINLKYRLFLNLEYGRAYARSMPDSRLYHMFMCDQLLRRDEYWDHLRYHSDIAHSEESRFDRCVYGCGWGVERYLPEKGQFVYKGFFGTVIYDQNTIMTSEANAEANLPRMLSALRCASEYLDGADLNALAATCSFMRANMFHHFPNKYLIYRMWRKKRHADGRVEWQPELPRHKFSKVQRPAWRIVQNADLKRRMEEHAKSCACKNLNYNELPLLNTLHLMKLVGDLSEAIIEHRNTYFYID